MSVSTDSHRSNYIRAINVAGQTLAGTWADDAASSEVADVIADLAVELTERQNAYFEENSLDGGGSGNAGGSSRSSRKSSGRSASSRKSSGRKSSRGKGGGKSKGLSPKARSFVEDMYDRIDAADANLIEDYGLLSANEIEDIYAFDERNKEIQALRLFAFYDGDVAAWADDADEDDELPDRF